MNSSPPCAVGERFVSLRTGKTVTVINVSRLNGKWCAQVETRPGWCKWLTCSASGINGYRRQTKQERNP